MAMTEGFSRGRRTMIGFSVLLSILVASLAWAGSNYVFTRAELRMSFDWTEGQQHKPSPETLFLIKQMRKRDLTLRIETFFGHEPVPLEVQPIYKQLMTLTRNLFKQVAYYGGDKVQLTHNNPFLDISQTKEKLGDLGLAKMSDVVLIIGKRHRALSLFLDMGDVEFPDASQGGLPPGQRVRPILRAYKGEEAIASALKGLLSQEKVTAYWLQGHFEGDPRSDAANGYLDFARDLVSDGFVNHLIALEDRSKFPAVPEDCSLLLILNASRFLSKREAGLVHDYLARGGSVLLTTGFDYAEWGRNGTQEGQRYLLEPLGIQISDKLLLNGILDPSRPGKGEYVYGNYNCSTLLIGREQMSATHPVTSMLRENRRYVDLYLGRSLSVMKDRHDAVSVEYLLHSNAKGYEAQIPPDYRDIRPAIHFRRPADEGQLGVHHLAVVLEVDGEAWGRAGNGNKEEVVKPETAPDEREGKKGRMAIISGLAFNNFNGGTPWFQSNRDFALTLVNWLIQRDSLVTVRSKDFRFGTIRLSPQQINRSWYLIYSLPLVLLLIAVTVVYWRRRA